MFPEMKAAIKARQKRNTVQAEANSTNSYDKAPANLNVLGTHDWASHPLC